MQVYALTGVPPEIQAYAMAKYSRSAQSMRESIAELSAQRAEEFLSTFYFQYGHRSIADLAHLALAVEEISILAAIKLVDEPLWDGQERSTRYQDFRKSGYHTPAEIAGAEAEPVYRASMDALFAGYHALTKKLTALLADAYAVPEGGDAAAHKRTLRARAFDVARYLLPLATRTSVGQITSARVLERQIARLRSDALAEGRAIGEAMRAACLQPGHDPTNERIRASLNGQVEANAALREALAPVRPAPTLIKYAEATAYPGAMRQEMAGIAATLFGETPADRSRAVELADPASPEDDAVATLLYGADAGGRSFCQAQRLVDSLSSGEKAEILDLAFQGRDAYAEWPRELHAGYPLTFDLLVDIGAFRDLHRHRRCVQIIQPFSAAHGYDAPESILRDGLGRAADAAISGGVADELGAALDAAGAAARSLAAVHPDAAAYALPLGYRVRAAFKMDLAEAAYIAELRTKPGGHIAYRRAAYQMWEALAARHPLLARQVRVTEVDAEEGLLAR